MNDLIDGLEKKPVAMSWTYTQQPLQIFRCYHQLSHAKVKLIFKRG
jgi:penicillin amidase